MRISKTHWNRFRFRGFNFVFVSSWGSDQWPTYISTHTLRLFGEMRLLCSLLFLSLLVCTIYAQEEDASISGRERWVFITSIFFPWLEDATNSQVIFFFAQREPQVWNKDAKRVSHYFCPEAATSAPKTHRSRATTTRPAANCPKERCLSSFICVHCFRNVVYQTVFVLLLSIRIKIIFIIIIPLPAGGWLLPLQGRHLLQRSNSLLSTWWGKDFHLLKHCIDLIRLLRWDMVWIFDRSCKQDFMKAFNDTWYLSTSSYTYIVDAAVHIAGKRFLKRF